MHPQIRLLPGILSENLRQEKVKGCHTHRTCAGGLIQKTRWGYGFNRDYKVCCELSGICVKTTLIKNNKVYYSIEI